MFGSGRVISGKRVIDKADLAVRARRAATALGSLGIDAGDVFAVFLRNDFAYLEARMAATEARTDVLEYRAFNRRFFAVHQVADYLMGAEVRGDYAELGVF